MSWTNCEGAAIDTPRKPRCGIVDALRVWAAGDSGRERDLVAWMLRDLLGFSVEEVARIESVYPRTVRRRIGRISQAIESMRGDM